MSGETAAEANGERQAIVVSGVSRRFEADGRPLTALSKIDLRIERGAFVTLFGPSGCGKSSLLRLLAGLDVPDEGAISLFGQSPKMAARQKAIAYVPQASSLLPWLTVKDNVSLPRVINRRAQRSAHAAPDVDAVLEVLGLSAFAQALPAQLSGGMQQRAAIARGFVQGAPIMLMDEPFAALDEITREQCALYTLALWQRYRTTVVFVTHSAAEAALLSDRVLVMSARPGRVVADLAIGLDRPRRLEMQDSGLFQQQVGMIRQSLRQACA